MDPVRDDDAVARLLEQIRDQQKLQLERQAESLALQREQFAMFQRQVERTEKLQDRAEEIQAKSGALVAGARRTFVVVLPILVALLVYVTWLILR